MLVPASSHYVESFSQVFCLPETGHAGQDLCFSLVNASFEPEGECDRLARSAKNQQVGFRKALTVWLLFSVYILI
jgi:hypothetical protein